MQLAARVAIKLARENNVYIVVDADGLFLIQSDPSVVKGYKRAVLTPNVVEFGRLVEACVTFLFLSVFTISILILSWISTETRQEHKRYRTRRCSFSCSRWSNNRPKRCTRSNHEWFQNSHLRSDWLVSKVWWTRRRIEWSCRNFLGLG